MAALFLISGCNHLFYHPDDVEYIKEEDVKFPSRRFSIPKTEGGELAAWRISTKCDVKRGVVLQAHGNAQNMTSHMGNMLYFLEHCFDAISFDYSGYGVSTGKPSRAQTLDDLKTVLLHLNQQEPSQKIILFGQSLGGAVTVATLGRDPYLQKFVPLIILDSTFGSYRQIARLKLNQLWLTWPLQYPLSFLVSDEDSAVDWAKNIHVPVLQVHAIEDPVVPIEAGRMLFQSFADNGQNQLVEYHSQSHTTGFQKPVPEVSKAFLTMFQKTETQR